MENKREKDGITNKKGSRRTYLSYLSQPLDKQKTPRVTLFSRANSNVNDASARESLMPSECFRNEDVDAESEHNATLFSER